MASTAPYGSWKSPITSDAIVAETIHFGTLLLDGTDVYWTELRPQESGRTALVVKTEDKDARDVLLPPFSARTRVHEYGGGAVTVDNAVIFFSNFDDQRLYRVDPGKAPRPLTPAADMRYADVCCDPARARLYCVREDHRNSGEAVNAIVVMPRDGDTDGGRVVAWGHDFFSSPRLSPDGGLLAWICWDHPNMPWDDTRLMVAPVLPDGSLGAARRVAGGEDESVMEPRWSPHGDLCFISDKTGFWNLYRARGGTSESVAPLCPMSAEVGGPAWIFGGAHYGFLSGDRLVFEYARDGFSRLAILDPGVSVPRDIDLPFNEIGCLRAAGESVFLIAGSSAAPECIVRMEGGIPRVRIEIVRAASTMAFDPGYLSLPRDIEFPTGDGQHAHGLYYAARNKDFAGPAGELPPLLVLSHGGPTARTTGEFNLEVQFWTSRGIAVLDVNYRGSSGYGRAYRNLLRGRWGIVDVDDCINGARFLAEDGAVDGARTMIEGGSAGGFTTLAALTFRSYFKAGASYYGIGDLEALARDTHKFESRYLDGLIGPYPAARETYRERSPAFFTERLSAPLILFQGLDDKVVPPSQAVTMFEALRKKGVPVAYLPFAGEQHGFRKAENLKRAIEAELFFYSRVFGFALADAIEPVEIENM